ncbi:MAG TPA: NINE protein [Chroococcidiopsis sp.]
MTNPPPSDFTPTPSPTPTPPSSAADKKIAAGICGIMLGALGIHKFILGYTTEGIIMLSVSLGGIVLSCLFLPILGTMAMGVIGLAEGIIYLTKTDEEFTNTYINNKKGWF